MFAERSPWRFVHARQVSIGQELGALAGRRHRRV